MPRHFAKTPICSFSFPLPVELVRNLFGNVCEKKKRGACRTMERNLGQETARAIPQIDHSSSSQLHCTVSQLNKDLHNPTDRPQFLTTQVSQHRQTTSHHRLTILHNSTWIYAIPEMDHCPQYLTIPLNIEHNDPHNHNLNDVSHKFTPINATHQNRAHLNVYFHVFVSFRYVSIFHCSAFEFASC